MSTNVKKSKIRYIAIGFLLLLLAPLAFWHMATPSVIIHYSKEGKEELRSVWNTQHRIYRERILPGQATIDTGYIFPGEEFFMMFEWWTEKGFSRCIDITPKRWGTIDIYLDETGKIDINKTSTDVIARLKQCKGNTNSDPFSS